MMMGSDTTPTTSSNTDRSGGAYKEYEHDSNKNKNGHLHHNHQHQHHHHHNHKDVNGDSMSSSAAAPSFAMSGTLLYSKSRVWCSLTGAYLTYSRQKSSQSTTARDDSNKSKKMLSLTGSKVCFNLSERSIRLHKLSDSLINNISFDKTFVAETDSDFFAWQAAIVRALTLWSPERATPSAAVMPSIQMDESPFFIMLENMTVVWIQITIASALGVLDDEDMRGYIYHMRSVADGSLITFCGHEVRSSSYVGRDELNAALVVLAARLPRTLSHAMTEFMSILLMRRSTHESTPALRDLEAKMTPLMKQAASQYTASILANNSDLVSAVWPSKGIAGLSQRRAVSVPEVLRLLLACPLLAPWSSIADISRKHLLSRKALATLSLTCPPESSPCMPGLNGMMNLGNTCFLNAVLQCLLHTPQLVRFLLTKSNRMYEVHTPAHAAGAGKSDTEKGVVVGGEGSAVLSAILSDLASRMWAGHHVLDTTDIADYMSCAKPRSFRRGAQHDAHEVLVVMLDILDRELSAWKTPAADTPRSYLPDSIADGKLTEDELVSVWETDYFNFHSSCIAHYFSGQTVQRIVCPYCTTPSYCCDPFTCLFAPLPEWTTAAATPADGNDDKEKEKEKGGGTPVTLEACLRQAFTPERMDMDGGSSRCVSCQREVQGPMKLLELQRLPPYLIICFNRFEQDADGATTLKNEHPVIVPQRLSLGPWLRSADGVLPVMEEGGNTRLSELDRTPEDRGAYELYGVVSHTGSLRQGHYTALCAVGENWWEFDDSKVNQLPAWSDDRAKHAYIAFYRSSTSTGCRQQVATHTKPHQQQ